MVSINYSASGSAALRALQATTQAMTASQTRIATGFRINGAKDDASVWRTAEALRSEIKTGQSAQNALKTAQVQVDTTSGVLEAIRTVLGQMRTTVNAASLPTANRANSQADMAASIKQLKSLVASASFDGINLLTGSEASDVLIGTDEDGAAIVMTLDTANLKLLSADGTGLFETPGSNWVNDPGSPSTKGTLLQFDVAATSIGALGDMLADLNRVIETVDDAVAEVASYGKRLETQSDFLSRIGDIQTSALSSLVDADLDEESARLSALQVQQQLAITALQIANQSAANILKLFQ